MSHHPAHRSRDLWKTFLRFLVVLICATMISPALAEPTPDESEQPATTKAKKLSVKDAAFIKVEAHFKQVTVTINGKKYPQHSEVGAAVAPGKEYEVLIKHNSSSKEGRYKVTLKKGEMRIIISDISGGSVVPVSASKPNNIRAEQKQEAEAKGEEPAEEGNGFLTVNSTPTSQVYIDGKLVASKTPLVKHKVSPGNHTVRVYYVELKKFSETKRAMITEGRHINLYFQSNDQ